ncbi:hypothetical protein [Haloarchaeobius sp. DFWS5]|uniref:hypothetical protein n=1 Tax=Haloarchaeobius sp. DFWS5 TaxID=3446114 RepID=UPI003EBF3DF4
MAPHNDRTDGFVVVALALLTVVVLAASAMPAAAVTETQEDANVTVLARYPADDGRMEERVVIAPSDVQEVSPPQQSQSGNWQVQIQLTESGAANMTKTLTETDFLDEGVGACPVSADNQTLNEDGYCLVTFVDGKPVSSASMGQGLANYINSGEFTETRRFALSDENESTAMEIARGLGWTEPTRTATEPATNPDDADGSPVVTRTPTADEGGSPGFGVLAGLAAVAVGLLAVRRTN